MPKPASVSVCNGPQGRIGLIDATASAAWTMRIAGLSVLNRTIAALGRAGAHSVYLLHPDRFPPGAVATAQRELAAQTNAPALRIGATPTTDSADLLVVARPVVFDPRILDRAGADRQSDVVVEFRRAQEPEAGLWRVSASRAEAILASIRSGIATTAVLASAKTHSADPGVGLCDDVSHGEPAMIERKLWAQARKTSDSWVARNVDRRVSLSLSRRLVDRPITPNQITLASTAIGLLGAAFLGMGTYATQLFGAVLLSASIIADGCDGEIARIKFMESELGRKLDFFLDNVVNVAAIFAVGAGFAWQSGQNVYLVLSSINAGAAAAAVFPVYSLFFRTGKEALRLDAPPATGGWSVSSLVESMAGRDFVYAILALALFGRAHWFAWICLGGMLGFLSIVSVLWLRDRVGPAGPH